MSNVPDSMENTPRSHVLRSGDDETGVTQAFPVSFLQPSPAALANPLRQRMVRDCLPRYTGMPLEKFRQHVLLTNFQHYVDVFAKRFDVEIHGAATPGASARPMQAASSEDITIINLGIGSPAAALVMDLLSAVAPAAALFLGKTGGVRHDMALGDLILPTSAIRYDGTSDYYFPSQVPAQPAFALQKAVSSVLEQHNQRSWTGPVFTTNVRIWEWNELFKDYLRGVRALAVDMETATLFTTGFYNKIPTGALLLVSDLPMTPEGVKTEASDREVTKSFVDDHLDMGLESLRTIIDNHLSVRHLRAW